MIISHQLICLTNILKYPDSILKYYRKFTGLSSTHNINLKLNSMLVMKLILIWSYIYIIHILFEVTYKSFVIIISNLLYLYNLLELSYNIIVFYEYIYIRSKTIYNNLSKTFYRNLLHYWSLRLTAYKQLAHIIILVLLVYKILYDT